MKKMTRSQAEKFISENGALDLLIALGVWTPEPEPVAEKMPWDILDETFHAIGGYSRRGEGGLFDDIEKAATAAGIKLIKASDELVAAPEPAAMQVLYEVGNASYGLHISRALCLAADLYRKGYVIAKRAGS